MVLAYSRMLYVEFIKAADQLHILQALRNALEFFGGVPRVMLSDNCSPLVVANDGQGHVDCNRLISILPSSTDSCPRHVGLAGAAPRAR
ncbi:hypothetical protein [Alicyclobacillus acidocaldarius]|uniref:hypothetical protein n=1 Tax=Alicyclobacillus acidocaldarius TaxID=405212 RepID=UPI00019DD3B3|nr:hypothetical protein [Alicyclobacillus acidocaldarius]